MAKKLVDRFVIKNVQKKVVESVDDMPELDECFNQDRALRVYDRQKESTIVKIDTGDDEFNFTIAAAVINACDEFTPTITINDVPGEDDDGN